MRWLDRLTDALVPTGSILEPEDTAPFDGSRYDSAGGYEIVPPRSRVCRGRVNRWEPDDCDGWCYAPSVACGRCGGQVAIEDMNEVYFDVVNDTVFAEFTCVNGCTWTPCGKVEGCDWGLGFVRCADVYHDAPNPCGSEG